MCVLRTQPGTTKTIEIQNLDVAKLGCDDGEGGRTCERNKILLREKERERERKREKERERERKRGKCSELALKRVIHRVQRVLKASLGAHHS